MTIKDRQSGMIMKSENPLVVEQWKKQGYTEYVKPEEKKPRQRRQRKQ